jgi:hypothetical protein
VKTTDIAARRDELAEKLESAKAVHESARAEFEQLRHELNLASLAFQRAITTVHQYHAAVSVLDEFAEKSECSARSS